MEVAYAPIKDACWTSREASEAAMLPLITAYNDWSEWDDERLKNAAQIIATLTINRIIAEMNYLPEEIRHRCRTAMDLTSALEAVQEGAQITTNTQLQRYPLAEISAIERAAMAAAEASWGAKRSTEAAREAACAAAYAAEAAREEKANPDDVLRTACQVWIDASSRSQAVPDSLHAGIDFPFRRLDGLVLRLERFIPVAKIEGNNVSDAGSLGVYGWLKAELPNPEVQPPERLVTIPIYHKSDFRSLANANLDTGVINKANEILIIYEHRRGIFGRKKACLHVAAYPSGTWDGFFSAVGRYAANEFRWPAPRFVCQPSSGFPMPGDIDNSKPNIFRP